MFLNFTQLILDFSVNNTKLQLVNQNTNPDVSKLLNPTNVPAVFLIKYINQTYASYDKLDETLLKNYITAGIELDPKASEHQRFYILINQFLSHQKNDANELKIITFKTTTALTTKALTQLSTNTETSMSLIVNSFKSEANKNQRY